MAFGKVTEERKRNSTDVAVLPWLATKVSDFPSRLRMCVRVSPSMYAHPSADKTLYPTRYAFNAAGVAINVVNEFSESSGDEKASTHHVSLWELVHQIYVQLQT